MIGKIINDPSKPGNRFEGYASKAETEKKILRDVFEKGDAWFRTGDLMRKDANGYFYFVDRIGDTFRWKGENVATSEVQEAITVFPGIVEANVYGVAIPGKDGRAGMAAVVAEGNIDLNAFREHLVASLPELCPPAVPAHQERDRRHRHVQAEEGRPRETGFRSDHHRRSDLFQRCEQPGVRAARPGALSEHPGPAGAGVTERAAEGAQWWLSRAISAVTNR